MDNKSSKTSNDSFFVKTVKKQGLRAKERVLEKLGKADKTQDELFDEYVNNINRQQTNALKLQKEVQKYVACLKAMDAASKSLQDVLVEVYEPEWVGQPQMQAIAEQLQQARFEHLRKLNDDLQNNVAVYLIQFPEAKNKVAKRNRKLVDFDAARYNLSAVLNAPKRNDAKALKAQDELNATQRMYESMNDELHRELPAIHESRIGFYGNSLKMLWDTEAVYHADSARIFRGLSDTADILAEQGKGSYNYAAVAPKKLLISGPVTNQPSVEGQEIETNVNENGHSVRYRPTPVGPADENQSETTTVVRDVTSITAEKGASGAVTTILASTNSAFSPVAPTAAERSSSVRMYPELPAVAKVYPVVETRVVRTRRQSTSSDGDEFPDTDVRSLASSARSTETVVRGTSEDHGEAASPRSEQSGGFVTPPSSDEKAEHAGGDTKVSNVPSYKVLYKVKATNPYVAEDQDELTFENGETISVIAFDNPDEQDEGWLMGIKESDGVRGVFPANFTKLITP